MPGGRDLPNLSLKAFFDPGENGWGDDMSLNLLKLSVLVQGGVEGLVEEEPAAPDDGDVVILDVDNADHPNAVAIRDAGAWVYVTPLEGWRLYDRATDAYLFFDGDFWVPQGDGLPEAPEDNTIYARQNGEWVPVVPDGVGIPEAPNDGEAYVRQSEGWVLLPETPETPGEIYRVGFFWINALTASEVVMLHTFTDTVTFADEFAGAVGDLGVNPAANFILDVQKNGGSVGSITISVGGLFTFTTAAGAVEFAVGDQLKIVGPGAVGTAAQGSVTLKGSI